MRRAQARHSYIFRYVVILLRVYWRKVTRARRTASADWWITPGTAGMRLRDLFTTSHDYRESVGNRRHRTERRASARAFAVSDSARWAASDENERPSSRALRALRHLTFRVPHATDRKENRYGHTRCAHAALEEETSIKINETRASGTAAAGAGAGGSTGRPPDGLPSKGGRTAGRPSDDEHCV
ncbi:hypothetical protein EVAR_39491_1 [Eumeta japonica]|uniref:Uncharacterized protein n=1 Tax=Eumeta variegata TaxID=151549 RepID=A0A4C1W1Q3_EUMVA|nr:hypothetical protein EVAR_39491_1 [Eumeta japonica]